MPKNNSPILVWGGGGHLDVVRYGGGEYATTFRLNPKGWDAVRQAVLVEQEEERNATQALPYPLTMIYADGVPEFPFVEDENCNITGSGHQDKKAFAAEVNRYDEVANGEPFPEDEQWTADDITHLWVVFDADKELIHSCEEDASGAFAVTVLWGAR